MRKTSNSISELFDINNLVPSHSVDCVIIGFKDGQLHVLTLRLKGLEVSSLPGGFVAKNEDLDHAALRVLKDRTGLELPFLKQFYTFGNIDRRDDKKLKELYDVLNIEDSPMTEWMKQRFITTGFLALVNMDNCELSVDTTSEGCQWSNVNDLPELMFDHDDIVAKALEHIKIQISYLPIGFTLLPKKFTMKELQNLYEAILKTSLDRANFQKKILRLGFLNRLEKHLTGGAHKAPYLYEINQDKYNALIEKGIGFI